MPCPFDYATKIIKVWKFRQSVTARRRQTLSKLRAKATPATRICCAFEHIPEHMLPTRKQGE